ncbi:hypothetical protein GMLC_21710 [Geomonas limicola]|uniref:Core-binding (CB) domain-containing protein n=1 Tax=Geomonas limicola TaxID=2740186 RepID=A0A6V8N7Q0_9BACT|nr:site-specific integrase [Geomonas limicola]GFO68592.1 hypothetical protein GMLC_21710 [Geomonas limicola]
MRGTIDWQTHELFKAVDCVGSSKHTAKEAAREKGAETWAEIGKEIGVHSYATADAYRDIWQAIGEHAKAETGLKDMTKLEASHVQSYLESKIEQGVSYATFQQYASAATKLEVALNRFAEQHGLERSYNWELRDVRAEAQQELSRFEGSRAYQDPWAAVAAMPSPDARLAASVQYEGGARIKEASHIKENQLKGVATVPHTGQPAGVISVIGKGGKERAIYVAVSTYRALETAVQQGGGRFSVSPDAVRNGLKESTATTKQIYTGSHGLRWNFAQERFAELQERGKTREEALYLVSNEMGHERSDITEHYLR